MTLPMIHFRAHFDGQRLCPDEPVSLSQGVPLEVKVTPSKEIHSAVGRPDGQDSGQVIDLASVFQKIEDECGLVDGPPDWSAEHDHYLYGTPKRSDAQQP